MILIAEHSLNGRCLPLLIALWTGKDGNQALFGVLQNFLATTLTTVCYNKRFSINAFLMENLQFGWHSLELSMTFPLFVS